MSKFTEYIGEQFGNPHGFVGKVCCVIMNVINKAMYRKTISLLEVKAEDNVLGKDILLFSNPNTTEGRHSMTIKASLDGGYTWLSDNQLLIDSGYSWGYSCLTMIDKETVGILYEGSVAHMTFQAIALKDIVRNLHNKDK